MNRVNHSSLHPIDETDIPISGHSRTMKPIQEKTPRLPISDQIDITKMIDELKVRTKCKHFTYELPMFTVDFFGRDDSIDELVSKLVNDPVQLLNINGPLGCGKSQLAIRLGYRLIDESLSVSYIDFGDRSFNLNPDNPTDPKKESLPVLPSVSYVHYPMFPKNFTWIHDVLLMEELLNWSQTLTCTTVLILDNCNSVKDKQAFVSYFQHLTSISSSPLKIVVTSQSSMDSFESWTIPELNMVSSMKLLSEVAPSIDKQHLDKLLALLGGCPLVLKITGHMLEHSQPHVRAVFNEIEVRDLNRVSSQHQQFHELLSILYNLLPSNLQVCGHYISLFPGSFDRASGENIMGSLGCTESIDVFIELSLVDVHFVGEECRVKMPPLIRKLFKDKGSHLKANDNLKTVNRNNFKRKFIANYVDLIVLDIMYPFRLRSPDEYNLKFSIESHNIHALVTLLFTKQISNSTLSLKEMTALLPLSQLGWVSRLEILNHFRLYKQLLVDMNPICKFLPGSRCVNFYTQLVTDVYYLECNSAHINFIQLIRTVFEGNENCSALFTNGTTITKLRIWNRLGPSIQSFILTASLLSGKFLAMLMKWFGLLVTLYAFGVEYLNLHKTKEDAYYVWFVLMLPAATFIFGMFLLFITGNSDVAVILHIYIPSTLVFFVLFLCCCHGTAYRLVLSYIFRIWCMILLLVVIIKIFFCLYSLLIVPFTNFIYML